VNGLNDAEVKYAEALSQGDVAKQVDLQALVKFHGGYVMLSYLFTPPNPTQSYIILGLLPICEVVG